MRDATHDEWTLALYSDALLRDAASYREAEDFFLRRKAMLTFAVIREAREKMAGKKRTPVIKDTEKANWQGLLDRPLTDDELASLDEWKPKPSEVWGEVDAMLQGGLRLTLSYNKRSNAACATIIDDDAARATGGYGLSSFDGDCAAALKMAIFKHAVLLQRDWTPLLSPDKPRVRRG